MKERESVKANCQVWDSTYGRLCGSPASQPLAGPMECIHLSPYDFIHLCQLFCFVYYTLLKKLQAQSFKLLKLNLRNVIWDFLSFEYRSEIRMGDRHLLESFIEGLCSLPSWGGHLLPNSMFPIGCKLYKKVRAF